MDKDLKDKLDSLETRIKSAKALRAEKEFAEERLSKEESEEALKGARAGSEFLASVFGGAILGFGIDWFFYTKPWGIIFFIVMGFISGVYRADAVMKKNSD